MQIPKLAKNMWKYLPVLAVLLATGFGLVIGNGLYGTSLDSPSQTPTQLLTEPKQPQLRLISGPEGACISQPIYTSLPPKCKTTEGKFIPLPGTSSNFFVIPERE